MKKQQQAIKGKLFSNKASLIRKQNEAKSLQLIKRSIAVNQNQSLHQSQHYFTNVKNSCHANDRTDAMSTDLYQTEPVRMNTQYQSQKSITSQSRSQKVNMMNNSKNSY